MGSSAKALFLEAMKLDESNELLSAASKYLEALLQFGALLLETTKKRSMIEIQSKAFGDETKAAMQCLERVQAIHQHFHTQTAKFSSAPALMLHADHTTERSSSSQRSVSPVSPAAALRHSDSVVHRTVHPSQASPNRTSNVLDPIASAVERNRRLIAQFHEVTRQNDQQQQHKLSDAQIARMETDLQRKLSENLAVAQQQQRMAVSSGSSATLPAGFERKASSVSVDAAVTRPAKGKRLSRQNAKKNVSGGVKQWITMGAYDTLALGIPMGDRYRAKSGDRAHARLNSEGSFFEESDFATLLDDGDSDNEVPTPPNGILPTIEDTFGTQTCSELTPDQKHQQQVIIELIHTERTHVRSMKVLQKLFYRPLARSNILPRNFVSYMPVTFMDLIFANLDEIVDMHTFESSRVLLMTKRTALCAAIGKELKGIERQHHPVHDIGAVLSKYFDGEFAKKFKLAVAHFCQHQQFAMEQLQLRRQQDSPFDSILKSAESHPACHGFKLRDILPIEMQRLSKYPLLFERLLQYSDKDNQEEIERLKQCHSNAQDILSYMNSCKRDFENAKRLAEIQSRMDTAPFYRVQHPHVAEFRRFNIQQHGFVFEGPLRMRRMDNSVIEMQGVLCDRILLLLTKRGLGADERLRLQFHEENVVVGARQNVAVQFCPIIKLEDAKLKDAASCDKEFYIISTCGEVTLYHLITPDSKSKTKWVKNIQKQIDKLSRTDGQSSIGQEPEVIGAPSTEESTGSNDVPPSAVVVVVDEADEDHDFDDDFSDDFEEPDEHSHPGGQASDC